jgi:hypothetical protein
VAIGRAKHHKEFFPTGQFIGTASVSSSITADGITYTVNDKSRQVRWGSIVGYRETGNFVILIYKKVEKGKGFPWAYIEDGCIIAKGSFSSGSLDELMALLADKGKAQITASARQRFKADK